jgi:hypothetical protein
MPTPSTLEKLMKPYYDWTIERDKELDKISLEAPGLPPSIHKFVTKLTVEITQHRKRLDDVAKASKQMKKMLEEQEKRKDEAELAALAEEKAAANKTAKQNLQAQISNAVEVLKAVVPEVKMNAEALMTQPAFQQTVEDAIAGQPIRSIRLVFVLHCSSNGHVMQMCVVYVVVGQKKDNGSINKDALVEVAKAILDHETARRRNLTAAEQDKLDPVPDQDHVVARLHPANLSKAITSRALEQRENDAKAKAAATAKADRAAKRSKATNDLLPPANLTPDEKIEL